MPSLVATSANCSPSGYDHSGRDECHEGGNHRTVKVAEVGNGSSHRRVVLAAEKSQPPAPRQRAASVPKVPLEQAGPIQFSLCTPDTSEAGDSEAENAEPDSYISPKARSLRFAAGDRSPDKAPPSAGRAEKPPGFRVQNLLDPESESGYSSVHSVASEKRPPRRLTVEDCDASARLARNVLQAVAVQAEPPVTSREAQEQSALERPADVIRKVPMLRGMVDVQLCDGSSRHLRTALHAVATEDSAPQRELESHGKQQESHGKQGGTHRDWNAPKDWNAASGRNTQRDYNEKKDDGYGASYQWREYWNGSKQNEEWNETGRRRAVSADAKTRRVLLEKPEDSGNCGSWEYLDKKDVCRGPFSNAMMRQWWELRMLPGSLRIRPYSANGRPAEKDTASSAEVVALFRRVAQVFEDAPAPFAPGWSPRATDQESQWNTCAQCQRSRWTTRSGDYWYCAACWKKWSS